MTRFLMMLDQNNDPSDGIVISSAVQGAASGWSTVNFNQTEGSFTTAVNSIVTSVGTVDMRTPVLSSAATAQAHVEATLRCARSGGFKGTYTDTDHGPVGVMVDATTGMVTGYFNSAVSPMGTPGSINGSTATTLDQSGSFTVSSGSTSTGASFTGSYSSPNAISGNWAQGANSGTFSLSRIGGQANAVHRFTGRFLGSGYGLFTFDVNATGGVSGVAYDVTSDALLTLSGNVTGTTLTGTASNGTQITGTLNTSTGALSGSWTNTALGASGTYSGGGCKLN